MYRNIRKRYLCSVHLYILLDVVVGLDDVREFWVCFCFKKGYVHEAMQRKLNRKWPVSMQDA